MCKQILFLSWQRKGYPLCRTGTGQIVYYLSHEAHQQKDRLILINYCKLCLSVQVQVIQNAMLQLLLLLVKRSWGNTFALLIHGLVFFFGHVCPFLFHELHAYWTYISSANCVKCSCRYLWRYTHTWSKCMHFLCSRFYNFNQWFRYLLEMIINVLSLEYVISCTGGGGLESKYQLGVCAVPISSR